VTGVDRIEEQGVALLAPLRYTEPPVRSGVDVGAAVRTGRRHTRARIGGVVAAAISLVTAVSIVVPTAVSPAPSDYAPAAQDVRPTEERADTLPFALPWKTDTGKLKLITMAADPGGPSARMTFRYTESGITQTITVGIGRRVQSDIATGEVDGRPAFRTANLVKLLDHPYYSEYAAADGPAGAPDLLAHLAGAVRMAPDPADRSTWPETPWY
jgi:hypothetical protein